MPNAALFDWRPGERRLASLMAVNYFLYLFFIYLLKPARDSLFLINLHPSNLPWVYILTALFAAPLVALHARAGQRMKLERLTFLTQLIVMSSLVLMRLCLSIPHDGVYFLLYGLVAVVGGVITSQFWLMANAMFDAGQARRLFPVLAIGGIAGGFVGGEFTGLLVEQAWVDTPDLMLAAVVVLGLAGLVTLWTWRCNPLGSDIPREEEVKREGTGRLVVARAVLGSRHLRLTVVLITLSVLAGSLVDFQFMTLSWQSYPDQENLTSFLGYFYGRVSLISLLIQLVLTTRLLKKLGAGGVLFLLPGILLLGGSFMLVMPGILAGMLLQGSNLTLKYSVDKTSRELLFLPVPLALKKKTKLFMDTMVDRFARGIAGLVLLACTMLWGSNLMHVAIITLVVVALWLLAAYAMRHAYIESFRQAVARRHFGIRDLTLRVHDSSSVKTLRQALEKGEEREVLFALRLLEREDEPRLVQAVRPHLGSASTEIRRLALRFLIRNGSAQDLEAVRGRLGDPDLDVRMNTIAFMARHWKDQEGSDTCLGSLLFQTPASRNGALAFLVENTHDESGEELRGLVDREVVQAILEDTSDWAEEGRAILARSPWLPVGCDDSLWDRLLTDRSAEVVCAACQGIGLRSDLSRAHLLFDRLEKPALRRSARRALVNLGQNEPELFPLLDAFMHDPGKRLDSRLDIPRILGRIPRQASVDLLMRHLASHIPEMRYQVLKALNRLRVADRQLVFDRRQVDLEINLEASRYLQLEVMKDTLDKSCPANGLLCQVIEETQGVRLESVFRLMGLHYRAADVAGAHARIMGRQRIQRANALEFLENILTREHRRLLHALLEKENLAATSEKLGLHGHDLPDNLPDALEYLSRSCDPWLAACAKQAGARSHNPAADVYLERKEGEMLTPVEKVLILQEVEVLRDLPTDLLAALATTARETHRLEGDILFEQDDHPDAMYIIVEGAVKNLRDGHHFVSSLRGEEVGLWALFHDEPRPTSAVVGQDALLLRIGAEDFQELLSGDIRVAKSLMKTMAGYLFHFVSRYGWPGPLDQLDLGIRGQNYLPGKEG